MINIPTVSTTVFASRAKVIGGATPTTQSNDSKPSRTATDSYPSTLLNSTPRNPTRRRHQVCYTVHHYHAPTKISPLSNKPLSRSIKATILTDGTYRPYRKANDGPLCIVFAKIMSLLLWFDEHEISEQYVLSLWYFMFCVQ